MRPDRMVRERITDYSATNFSFLPSSSRSLISKYAVQLEEIKHSSPTCTQHHTLVVNYKKQ